jgi:hypothetical protein
VIRREFVDVQFVLIGVGYSSPQVEDILQPLSTFYLRYDPSTFRTQFEKIIEQLSQPKTIRKGDVMLSVAPNIEARLAQLEDLLSERRSEEVLLESRLTGLLRESDSARARSVQRNKRFEEIRSRPIVVLFVFLTFLGVIAVVIFQNVQNQQARQNTVSQSLALIKEGQSPDLEKQRDDLLNYISGNRAQINRFLESNSDLSVFSLLAQSPPTALGFRRLAGYYNSAYTCLTSKACDPTNLCPTLVGDINSFNLAAGIGTARQKVRGGATQSAAERVLDFCGRVMPSDLSPGPSLK